MTNDEKVTRLASLLIGETISWHGSSGANSVHIYLRKSATTFEHTIEQREEGGRVTVQRRMSDVVLGPEELGL